MDFGSLSDVLRHSIRRKILLSLSETESGVSYVDLMELAGVKNTGRFNYHLKVLGDLIAKDEDGRYGLSDKGWTAVRFLQKLAGEEAEPTPLLVEGFETRTLAIFPGFMWMWFVHPVTVVLFGWYLYFAGGGGAFIGDQAVPLMILTLLIVPIFALFGVATFPKLKVEGDGVVVRLGLTRRFFALQEVTIDSRGHTLKLGEGWTSAGWFIPFQEKECMDLLDKHVGIHRSKPLYLIYLLPVAILGLYHRLARHLGGTLAPLFWAFSWGFTVAISMAMLVYAAPGNMRIGRLHRGASATVYGLSIGIIIFILMFFSLQLY